MADGGVLDGNAKDRMLKKLYGPERNLLRDNHVAFMRKDNVLMKGMAYDLDCPQQSTTRASYRVRPRRPELAASSGVKTECTCSLLMRS